MPVHTQPCPINMISVVLDLKKKKLNLSIYASIQISHKSQLRGNQWDEHQADTNHHMSVFLEAAIIKSVSAQF